MKLFKLAIGLLGLSLAACSSEDPQVPQEPGGEVAGGDSRYMSVTIRNANGGRAAGDQAGNLFEEGLTGENAITKVRFYFFDETGGAVPVKSDGTNFYDCTEITEDGSDMPNVEKILKAVIVINTQNGDNLADLKKMVAVANMNLPEGNPGIKTFAQLQEIIDAYNTNGGAPKDKNSTLANMPMTSSVFGTGINGCASDILPSNICTSQKAAKDNPVDVYIERIQAKVRVSFAWEGMTTSSVTYNGKSYTAVKLSSRTTEGGTTTTTPIQVDGKDVYAMFTGWCPTGVAKQSFAFKKFDAGWSLGWSAVGSHRSYWAQNPYADPSGNAHSTTLTYYKPSDAIGTFGSNAISGPDNGPGSSKDFDGSWYYIQENASTKDNAEGKKVAFDPATQLSNRTQVFFGAMLVTIEGGVATPLSLAEWGGSKYTESGLIDAILNVCKNQIYLGKKTTEGEGAAAKDKWEFRSLLASEVKLVSGTDIENGLFDAQDDLRYLTYLQLVTDDNGVFTFPAGYEHKFYKSLPPAETAPTAENEYTDVAAVNNVMAQIPGAKVWNSGMTYYYTDIVHESTATTTTGGYGVVRNHIYDIELNSVYGLGTPIYDPDDSEIIIPQKPQDLDSFIGARINVLSWRVIRQNVSLDWD